MSARIDLFREQQMDEKKTRLSEMLARSVDELYKAPNARTYTVRDLMGIGLAGKAPEPRGLGLAGILADGPAKRTNAIDTVARALFGRPTPGTEEFIEAVWAKASVIPGINPQYVRRDRFGTSIGRYDYGEMNAYGWHVDHHIPKSLGGSDELFNAEPLHWRNNLAKSDSLV